MSYCDEKIQLSVQAYEQVDKCIKMLDEDLAAFTKLLNEEQDKKTQQMTPLTSQPQREQASALPTTQQEGGSRRRRQPPVSKPFMTDMPIDPNEPVYCYCRKVSFGKMVGCDNENVIFFKK